MIVPTLMQLCRSEFEALAKTWLLLGAIQVTLHDDGLLIAHYPGDLLAAEPDLSASDPNSGLSMHLYGIKGAQWQIVADAQMHLLGRLLGSEGEMDSLTGSLVETQDRLVALYDLTRATRGAMEIRDVLCLLAVESTRLLDAHGAFAVVKIPDQAPIIHQFLDSPYPNESLLLVADLFFLHPEDNNFKECSAVPPGLGNVVMLILSVRPQVQACLGILYKSREISSPDSKLLKAITDQGSASLDNALFHLEAVESARLETEMTLARQVQTALLPQSLPKIKGVDIYGISIPASQVGGDFFFITSNSEHALTFYLGDVTGKGMPAALLMSMTNTSARSAIRYMPFSEPHILIDRLNNDLLEDYSAVDMFVTIFVGMFDPDTHQLLFANAGQSPVIYASPNQETILLEADDLPVGIFENHHYSMKSLNLSQGDILVITTDGFNETSNEKGELFGIDRMKNIINRNSHRSAKEIAESLCAAVSEYGGSDRQEDDRTLLIMKVTGDEKPVFHQTEMEVYAEYEQLRIPAQVLREVCSAAGVSEDLIGKCELALQELLTNLVNHAYEGNPQGVIRVSIQVTADRVIMQTEDSGNRMESDLDSVEMPDPLLLQESGYGMAIIKGLMDEVTYRNGEGKNFWLLAKNYTKE